jgi:hypothetical protein
MRKKKRVDQTESKIELTQRKPRKVTQDYFAEFKQRALKEVHPIDEMFPEKAGTQKTINGDTQEELTGIIIPEIDKRIPVYSPIVGINIPTEELTYPRKSEETPKIYKRGRPATGRTKADVHVRLDKDIWQQTRVLAAKNDLELSQLVELALASFIEKSGDMEKELTGINVPLDDRRLKIFYKTNALVINLFREYNKIFNPQTEWKPKDDAVGVKYNSVDLRLIEIGIIQTQSNILENESDTKVERFKYYTREIDKFIATGYSDQLLDAILTTNRKRWKEITGRELDLSFLDKE